MESNFNKPLDPTVYLKIYFLRPMSEFGDERVVAEIVVGPFPSEEKCEAFCKKLADSIAKNNVKYPEMIKFVSFPKKVFLGDTGSIPPEEFPNFIRFLHSLPSQID